MNIDTRLIDEQTAFNNAWIGIHNQGKLGTAGTLVDKDGCFCSIGASLTQEERDYYVQGRWNAPVDWGRRDRDGSSEWDEYFKNIDAMYDKIVDSTFRQRLYTIHDDVATGFEGWTGVRIEGDKMSAWEERMRALAETYNLTVPE